jgi:hypothetical protein
MVELAKTPEPSWLELASRRDVVSRAFKVGTIVGVILIALNQGDLILAGAITSSVALKIVLTPLVPYLVSTYSSVAAIRSGTQSPRTQN